jgi:intracellular sulfur oxidation DsrE/DsrF family protein
MQSVKVVFHIDEIDKWPLLLANVCNLIKAVDVQSSEVVVLANSKAVSIFDGQTEPNHSEAIAAISIANVKVQVCENSLNGLNIEKSKLPGGIEVVPVGVLALIEKQTAGFAYIKP